MLGVSLGFLLPLMALQSITELNLFQF